MTSTSAADAALGSPILVLIGLFKLLKAALLLVVGFEAVRLLHQDVAAAVTQWANTLHVDPNNHYIHRVMASIFSLTPEQLTEVGAGAFFYAGLLTTEGTGLVLRKRWAEYFTIIATAGFIPLEIFELSRYFTAIKLIVLLVNLAIVGYLIVKVRSSPHR